MKNSGFIVLVLVFLVFILLPGLAHAQVGGGVVGDPGCDPFDPDCPIDGGLSLLIAAGIGIGAKKAYEGRKKADELNDGKG